MTESRRSMKGPPPRHHRSRYARRRSKRRASHPPQGLPDDQPRPSTASSPCATWILPHLSLPVAADANPSFSRKLRRCGCILMCRRPTSLPSKLDSRSMCSSTIRGPPVLRKSCPCNRQNLTHHAHPRWTKCRCPTGQANCPPEGSATCASNFKRANHR